MRKIMSFGIATVFVVVRTGSLLFVASSKDYRTRTLGGRAMRNLLSASVLVTAFAGPAAADYFVDCKEYWNPDKAIRACTVMMRFEPQNPGPYAYRGSAYMTKKDFDSAIRDLSEAIRLDRQAPPIVYELRGIVYQDKGQSDQALADFNEAIRRGSGRSYKGRGEIYLERKDYDRALADFDKAVELDPKDPEGLFDRGKVRYVRKDFDRAIADFSAALKLDPNVFIGYYMRALSYYHAGKAAAGLADIEMAVGLDPKDVDAVEWRAVILERLGRRQDAIAGYRAALALDTSKTISREALSRLGAAR
jgi:tetratricopeptide (TPR) repeat protein